MSNSIQVISKSSILQQISELVEEAGLTCIICREGYKFEPKKVNLNMFLILQHCFDVLDFVSFFFSVILDLFVQFLRSYY